MSISILIVEDQEDIRNHLRELLCQLGYEVRAVSDAEQATALLADVPRPCIVLWDAMMPRQSLSVVDQAALRGVHVATIPVSMTGTGPAQGSSELSRKRLTSDEAVVRIVQEQCPHPAVALP